MARTVAQHFAGQGMVAVLKLPVAVELPPVGLITLRGQRMTPVTALLVECLRQVAKEFVAPPARRR
ncbi:LysR family transcriptional regulator, partial [Acidovorax sp. FJL06]